MEPTEKSQLQNELTFINKLTEEETDPPSSAIGVTPDKSLGESYSAENQAEEETNESAEKETEAIQMTCGHSDDNAKNPSDNEQRPASKFSWTSIE